MHDRPLHDRRILVVEDEYLLADELRRELEEAGAIVIGPVATLQAAFVAVDVETGIDGAVLDVNLGGDWIFPLADLLLERSVPMVFATGYDASVIPSRFNAVTRCEKPVDCDAVTLAIIS